MRGTKTMQIHTKYEAIQASIRHVLIDQYPFHSFNATTKEPNEILVLEIGNKYNLIYELLDSLVRTFGKPFDCYFLPIR